MKLRLSQSLNEELCMPSFLRKDFQVSLSLKKRRSEPALVTSKVNQTGFNEQIYSVEEQIDILDNLAITRTVVVLITRILSSVYQILMEPLIMLICLSSSSYTRLHDLCMSFGAPGVTKFCLPS